MLLSLETLLCKYLINKLFCNCVIMLKSFNWFNNSIQEMSPLVFFFPLDQHNGDSDKELCQCTAAFWNIDSGTVCSNGGLVL